MRKGVTIIETAVVGLIAVVAGGITVGGLSNMSSKAETAKCLNNLKRTMTALQLYTTENNGILPGPIHMAVTHWKSNDMDLNAQRKSIAWHIRPYFDEYGPDSSDPHNPNPVVDALLTCPSFAPVIQDFFCRQTFSYVMNTWGPLGYSDYDPEWFHTDPPNYFGAWFYNDQYPIDDEGNYRYPIYEQRSWRPKTLESIPNSSSEWAIGDAWSRRIVPGSTRPGEPQDREYLGTFPSDSSNLLSIPCAPPHDAPKLEYAVRPNSYHNYYPQIDFTGKTNQGFFDGHAASFSGNWQNLGDGGTINPLWTNYGGTHTTWDPSEYE